MGLAIKRVYEPVSATDGYRILVDRLWPRGLSKEHAAVDLWLKAIAPSTELRRWFGHAPEKWPEFRRKYFAELAGHGEELAQIRALARRRRVTLVYGARETGCNDAVAILEYLQRHS
jgi:uncharacterized protein YeaO (DUF488 family)